MRMLLDMLSDASANCSNLMFKIQSKDMETFRLETIYIEFTWWEKYQLNMLVKITGLSNITQLSFGGRGSAHFFVQLH